VSAGPDIEQARFSMRAIPRRGVAIAVAIVAVAIVAAPKLLQLRRASAPQATQAAASVLRVRVHRVEPALLTERLATTGTLRANEEVEIVSEIAGKISAISFEEGSRVAAGDLLLKIDDSELVAERQRALYELELAERAEARQRRLLDDGVISTEDYDVSLGELNVLRAELQLIEAQLVKTEIRAPFAGVIGLRWVSPGSFLSPQTRIASLADTDPIKIDFTVPERHAGLLQVGDPITFTIQGADTTFSGNLYAIEPGVDAATRSLRMRARCPNPDGALVPGAFANVELVLHSVPDALTVPSIAVIPELGGKKVYLYQDGVAEPQRVETGIRTEEAVQITSGLEPGALVIVSGLLQLQPGLPVEIDGAADAADVDS
jgi:membrane fusion protein (multidrug efflux system)